MLSSRQAFKAAYIYHCLREGLTPEQMCERAEGLLAKEAGILGGVGSFLGGWGVPAALALPVAGGLAAGAGAARMTDTDVNQDISEVKQRELTEQFRRLAARDRRLTELRRREEEAALGRA